MWRCEFCGRENPEEEIVYKNCGATRDSDIGDSGDNENSEDLFFDDEYL